MALDYHHVSRMSENRWRAIVKRYHVGVYRTAHDAAVAADRYIVTRYEMDNITNIGNLKLNFPDEWPTPEQRAIACLQQAGYIDGGRITLAPDLPDDMPDAEEVTPYEDNTPTLEDDLKQAEIIQWYRAEDTDRPSWWDRYYWDNEKNTAAYTSMAEFKQAVENGWYDPR